MNRKESDSPTPLTPRELMVLNLVGEGKTDAEVWLSLACATGTVKKHVLHIYRKLKVRNRISTLNRCADQSKRN